MFEIPRPRLTAELWDLTQSGSVFLSGPPGTGKSWLQGQLVRRCKQESRKVTSISTEDFQVSSLRDIYDGLRFTKPLPQLLAAITDPILIIDGLDALRGEASQRAFRELITEVLDQAPNASIVASIRTFDLQESMELQALLRRYSGAPRGIRKMMIGELSDNELRDAAVNNPELAELLLNRSEPLFELLRNPFNLHLALTLRKEGIPVSELQSIPSQVQLLEKYWTHRVLGSEDGSLRERLLREISERMVESRTLSIPETEVVQPGYQDALHRLKSGEVLRKGSTGRLSYGHNILFDYAISRLLLDEYRIFHFVESDPVRSLFFRPSLTFFFHRLWAIDRALFWRVTSSALTATNIPERFRVLPAVVVSEAVRAMGEISLKAIENAVGTSSTEFIRLQFRAMLAMRALEGKQRALWSDWFLDLTTRMKIDWINEALSALAVLHTTMSASERGLVGRIARNILSWEMGPPEGLAARQAAQLAAVVTGRVLPIIADTFESDPPASEGAYLGIVNRLGAEEAASNEAFWLANSVSVIIDKSPSLAERIYLTLYAHEEDSEEQTSLGGGIITHFTSTRKQDFSSALYGLTARFQRFLERDSVRATRVAIQATEREVAREKLKEEGKEFETIRFKLGKRMITYRADYSEIWDGGGSREFTSLSLLDAALEFASHVTDETRHMMIQEIYAHASLGISWMRLLRRARLHPEELYAEVKPLLFVPKFISAPEVTTEVGEILKVAYARELVSEEDSKRIEDAIAKIENAKVVLRYAKKSTIQKRLTGCLPSASISNPKLLSKIEKWGESKAIENSPFFRTSFGAVPFSIDDQFRREGIDLDTPANSLARAAATKVREFEGRYPNAVPEAEECIAIEPALRALHEAVRIEELSAQIAESGRGTLYAAAHVIARNDALGPDSSIVQFCRSLAIEGSVDPEPVFDPRYHLPFDHAGWGSPSPRIEAAQALGQLIWNYFSDDEILQTFLRTGDDEVPAVRFQTARWLPALYKQNRVEMFWQSLTAMIQKETTSGVMQALLSSIGRVAGRQPARTMDAVEAVITKGLPATDRSETRRALVEIPVALYAVQGTERAREVLIRLAAAPVRNSSEISDAIFGASHYFDPKKTEDEQIRFRAREVIGWLLRPARDVLVKREELKIDPEDARKLLQIIDAVATRIVFSFGLSLHGVTGDDVLNDSGRAKQYIEVKPLIEELLGVSAAVATLPLMPRTAYYLLQLMNGILALDPVAVLGFAARICEGGSYFGFELDASARDEAVKLVDRALADHKDTLKDSATSVGQLLDLFVKAGWSEALALTFRLDEAFR